MANSFMSFQLDMSLLAQLTKDSPLYADLRIQIIMKVRIEIKRRQKDLQIINNQSNKQCKSACKHSHSNRKQQFVHLNIPLKIPINTENGKTQPITTSKKWYKIKMKCPHKLSNNFKSSVRMHTINLFPIIKKQLEIQLMFYDKIKSLERKRKLLNDQFNYLSIKLKRISYEENQNIRGFKKNQIIINSNRITQGKLSKSRSTKLFSKTKEGKKSFNLQI